MSNAGWDESRYHDLGGMTMRWLMPALAGLVLCLVPADAFAQRMRVQDPEAAAATRDSIVAVYVTRLNLTNEQQAGIRKVLEAQAEKAGQMMEKARGGGREAMMEMRPQFEELQRETDSQVESFLTGDQLPEYRKIREEMEAQRRERRRQRTGGP